MSESKHTIPVNGKTAAAEEQSSAAGSTPVGEQGESVVREQGAGERQAQPADAPTAPAAAVVEHGDGAAELAGDLDELGKLAAKRDEYLALAQRTQADFENYRKRVAKESALAQERGVAKLAKELLPALDNLDRALEAAATDDPLLEGVRLVRTELKAALARVGVESFSPGGQVFDPSQHEAMASVPQPENGPASGTVVEVYQPGYRLGESVIRPARVVVAA
ncbi:MAG TPA: nucleotide exchange factor GrpE [Solirubrobacteraceae bacterium]|nr:nucleotide exchange factor GrpE [Solirubrobacteraceae bacterium]